MDIRNFFSPVSNAAAAASQQRQRSSSAAEEKKREQRRRKFDQDPDEPGSPDPDDDDFVSSSAASRPKVVGAKKKRKVKRIVDSDDSDGDDDARKKRREEDKRRSDKSSCPRLISAAAAKTTSERPAAAAAATAAKAAPPPPKPPAAAKAAPPPPKPPAQALKPVTANDFFANAAAKLSKPRKPPSSNGGGGGARGPAEDGEKGGVGGERNAAASGKRNGHSSSPKKRKSAAAGAAADELHHDAEFEAMLRDMDGGGGGGFDAAVAVSGAAEWAAVNVKADDKAVVVESVAAEPKAKRPRNDDAEDKTSVKTELETKLAGSPRRKEEKTKSKNFSPKEKISPKRMQESESKTTETTSKEKTVKGDDNASSPKPKNIASEEKKTTPAKAKTSPVVESDVIPGTPQEQHDEQRRQKQAAYRQYLARGGARNPGSKPVPDPTAGSLAGLVFVLTGVFESLEREQAAELVKRAGAKVTSNVSKNTSYVVVGDQAGESKLKKAATFGTKRLDEDGLLELIRSKADGVSGGGGGGARREGAEKPQTPAKIKETKAEREVSKSKEVKTESTARSGKTEVAKSKEVKTESPARSKKTEVVKSKEVETGAALKDKTESRADKDGERRATSKESKTSDAGKKSGDKNQTKLSAAKGKETKLSASKGKETKRSPSKDKETKLSPSKDKETKLSPSKNKETKLSPRRERESKPASASAMGSPTAARSSGGASAATSAASSPAAASAIRAPKLPKLKREPSAASSSQNSAQSSSQQSSSQKSSSSSTSSSSSSASASGGFQLWVDKYKPTASAKIIGQQGDRSNMNKLKTWLNTWQKNHGPSGGGDRKPRPPPWGAANDNGAWAKAALLSGPPGVGKTTTAYLVSRECGFDVMELNASDTRSKKQLTSVVAEALASKSLGKTSDKRVVLMDEVDGMAGNEDRGGVAELIQLIKSSKIPVICMCNDRNHQKIRSLAGHCFDLRFQRPRVEQIKSAMMSVCFKEGVKISGDALTELIVGCNQDVRQVLHHLTVINASDEDSKLEKSEAKAVADKAKKTSIKVGPWDVCKRVFSSSDHAQMSLYDKSDLFFHDYSIGPLFVAENYLSVTPEAARGDKKKTLELVSRAADSLCEGDLVERMIRSKQSWNLLPVQAIFSSVVPGDAMSGFLNSQIQFPQWLGKNSRRTKFDRILQELQAHTRLSVGCGKGSLNRDYIESMRDAIVRPLAQLGAEGVPQAVKAMDDFALLRDDLDNLLEITQWPGRPEPMRNVDSKVKSAFTRAYNRDCAPLPYAVQQLTAAKKKSAAAAKDDWGDGDDEEETPEDDDDVSTDAMIKAKKPSKKGKQSAPDKPPKGKTAESDKPSKGKPAASDKPSKGKPAASDKEPSESASQGKSGGGKASKKGKK